MKIISTLGYIMELLKEWIRYFCVDLKDLHDVSLSKKSKRHKSVPNTLSSQGNGVSCGHVWMWELDCEESWASKNWCFWTVVLEKTFESPLDCKEIQPVHSEGDQPWDFFGRNVHWRRKWKPTPVFLPGESQGRGSLVGCHLWGRTESDTTEAT